MKRTKLFSLLLLILFCISGLVFADNQKADEYWYKAQKLASQGKYHKAAQFYVKSAENEESDLSVLADKYNTAGYYFYKVGHYEEALYYYEKALAIFEVLNQIKNQGLVLNNMGMVYYTINNYMEALEYFEKALEVNKVSGRDQNLATGYRTIGSVYRDLGDYRIALNYFNKSLKINQRLGREIDIATDYRLIGIANYLLRKYEKALKYLHKSLEIFVRLESEKEIAVNYHDIGSVYNARGEYKKALEFYNRSLEIDKSLGREKELASDYNSIGSLYHELGEYKRALEYYNKSLEIDKSLGREESLAVWYNNIGSLYEDLGEYKKALKYYNKSLEIDKRLGREENLAIRYNNMGSSYDDLGEYEKALEYYNMALEINKKLGRKEGMSNNYNNIGLVYRARGEYKKALEYYNRALEIDKRLKGREGELASRYNNIGYIYALQKKYQKAAEKLLQSIELKEQIRKKAPTDELKRTFLQSQIATYQALILVYINDGQLDNAFNIMELSKAKVLAERLAGEMLDLSIPYLQEVQQGLSSTQGLLIYANSNWKNMVEMSVTSESKKALEISKEDFIRNIHDKYGPEIDKMVKRKKRLKEIKASLAGETNELYNTDNDDFENIIYYYRERLTAGKDIEYMARELYRLLITPLKDEIKDKEELVIVPDGILNFIPFETLIDDEGVYLVEKYRIRYIQSETVLEMVKDRDYPEERKGLLAFGGAVYEKEEYTEDKIENEKQLIYLQNQVDRALAERGSIKKFYNRLGYGSWTNLPGTLVEVKSLKKIIKDVVITTGEDVKEEKIKELSQEGVLADYKVLHFATHGIVVTEIPELSAVVLSQLKGEQKEDGYLRMGEIIDLNIKADFVNLSACNTGLGKIYAGEGVVGLTQSFLLAGAKSLSVSLWSVEDESTARFMVAVYKLVNEKDMGYQEAMNEVKLRFIDGAFGQKYQHPYYWAPFVYYGG